MVTHKKELYQNYLPDLWIENHHKKTLPAFLVLLFHLISADWLGHWGGVFGQDRLLSLVISAVTDDTYKINYLMYLTWINEKPTNYSYCLTGKLQLEGWWMAKIFYLANNCS